MRFILYFLLLLTPPVLAVQAAGGPPGGGSILLAGDADFLAAHDAFLSGDTVKLDRYAQRLKKMPLEVYVSYYQLSLALKNADNDPAPNPIPGSLAGAVKDFLSRPEDTPMIGLLRGEWLKVLGKKQQWDLFDAEYPHLRNEDTELTCYALQSRRRSEEAAALGEARKLWFTGKEQPDSCGTLFDAALSAGIISKQDAGQRLRLALEANNVSLASTLAAHLDEQYAGLPAMLKSAAADPDRYLKKLAADNTNSTNTQDMPATPVSNNAAIETAISGNELPPPCCGSTALCHCGHLFPVRGMV